MNRKLLLTKITIIFHRFYEYMWTRRGYVGENALRSWNRSWIETLFAHSKIWLTLVYNYTEMKEISWFSTLGNAKLAVGVEPKRTDNLFFFSQILLCNLRCDLNIFALLLRKYLPIHRCLASGHDNLHGDASFKGTNVFFIACISSLVKLTARTASYPELSFLDTHI